MTTLPSLADLKNVELAENFAICGSHTLCLQQALILWKKEAQESFPKGIGTISTFNCSNCQSKIQWFSHFLSYPRLSIYFLVHKKIGARI